ncbi:MAG: protein arginine kinase [Syntrophomonadaceae bacterium]|nr:protein arginine kinase [Syntrophomonadaceae bacterium]
MKKDLFNNTYVGWMEQGPESNIVISSRVRLARNLQNMPFPQRLHEKTGLEIINLIKKAWQADDKFLLKDMDWLGFDQLSELDRTILMEKHLVSPGHAQSSKSYNGLLVNHDGSISIMINEEDHLRIQCLLPGLQVQECLQQANEVDDILEERLDIAFDEQRGYLTSCPTNVGTGMRASVMLHLPAIAITGQLNQLVHHINQLGMIVRGIYGEGSEATGNFFQLSNQITLGQMEHDIGSNLVAMTRQIVQQEQILRDNLNRHMRIQIEDRVGRAYGVLTNARMITSNEALTHLSDLRLGVDLGIIEDISLSVLNELMVAIRPAHLQRIAGSQMDALSRDVNRAKVIKEILQSGHNSVQTADE